MPQRPRDLLGVAILWFPGSLSIPLDNGTGRHRYSSPASGVTVGLDLLARQFPTPHRMILLTRLSAGFACPFFFLLQVVPPIRRLRNSSSSYSGASALVPISVIFFTSAYSSLIFTHTLFHVPSTVPVANTRSITSRRCFSDIIGPQGSLLQVLLLRGRHRWCLDWFVRCLKITFVIAPHFVKPKSSFSAP
ncbi:hypothetical protein B0H13DRAFT_1928333 [Mycena leptocephala]|nr:hypothetical protein B0H13DRAFT_1928333 [Mycena leptocephala]